MAITLLSDNAFYSSMLREPFKSLYQAALTSLAKKKPIIYLTTPFDGEITQADANLLMHAIIYEHPELFFVKQDIDVAYKNGRLVLITRFIYLEEEIDELDKYLNKKIDEIVNELKEFADDPVQLLYKLNEYLCFHFDGENSFTRDNGNALGVVLNNRARCEGFCKVAKLVLKRFNIDSIICTGYVSPNNNPFPHAWLAIKYQDQYYAFDFAFNTNSTRSSLCSPVYTFMDKETILIDKSPNYDYPITNDKSLLFWKLHHGETYHISELANADVVSQNNGFVTVHHLLDFGELTEEEKRFQLPLWIEANLAPYTKGHSYRHVYIDELHVLIVYYFND